MNFELNGLVAEWLGRALQKPACRPWGLALAGRLLQRFVPIVIGTARDRSSRGDDQDLVNVFKFVVARQLEPDYASASLGQARHPETGN